MYGMIIRMKNDYFPTQLEMIGLCNWCRACIWKLFSWNQCLNWL